MNTKSYFQSLGNPLAILGSLAAFIVASGNLFDSPSVIFILFVIIIPVLGFISIWFSGKSNLKRQVSLGLVINGMSFWGIGWILILLVNPIVGWWVYMVGWLSLSLGLCTYGSVEVRERKLPNETVILLLLGLIPVTAEFASPYRFANDLAASSQLFVMLFFSIGWILIGYTLSNLSKNTKLLRQLSVNTSSSNA